MNRNMLAALVLVAVVAFPSISSAAWAIAIGETGDPFAAQGCKTPPEAEAHALEACRANAGACKVVLSDWYGCAAAARGGDGRWRFGGSHSKPRAHKAALAICAASGAAQCKVVHEFC